MIVPNLLPAFGTFAGMMNRETESITATLLWEERAIRFSTLAAALVLLADIPEAEAAACRVIPLFRPYALDALPWLPPFKDSISGACLS